MAIEVNPAMTCLGMSWLARFFCIWSPPIQDESSVQCCQSETCCICLEQLTTHVVRVSCQAPHFFHRQCIANWFKKQLSLGRPLLCPLCQQPVSTRLQHCLPSPVNDHTQGAPGQLLLLPIGQGQAHRPLAAALVANQ